MDPFGDGGPAAGKLARTARPGQPPGKVSSAGKAHGRVSPGELYGGVVGGHHAIDDLCTQLEVLVIPFLATAAGGEQNRTDRSSDRRLNLDANVLVGHIRAGDGHLITGCALRPSVSAQHLRATLRAALGRYRTEGTGIERWSWGAGIGTTAAATGDGDYQQREREQQTKSEQHWGELTFQSRSSSLGNSLSPLWLFS